jgi:hypothetical protein
MGNAEVWANSVGWHPRQRSLSERKGRKSIRRMVDASVWLSLRWGMANWVVRDKVKSEAVLPECPSQRM